MPISDNYVVQYLLQTTRAGHGAIVWKEKESDGYVAQIRGIEAQLDSVPSRAGARLCLTLSWTSEEVHIEEPQNTGFFRPKYESYDQEQLARLMKELASTVARQCAVRSNGPARGAELVREAMYKRLIGASEA